MKLFMKAFAAVILIFNTIPLTVNAASEVVDFENGDFSAFYM